MKDIDSITIYVDCIEEMCGEKLPVKTGINIDRIKILRVGSGFEFTPTRQKNNLNFRCHTQYFIELVYDGDFERDYPNAKINAITVIYHNNTLDKYFNCKLLDVHKQSRITYLLVDAD